MSRNSALSTTALHDLKLYAVFSQPKYEPETVFLSYFILKLFCIKQDNIKSAQRSYTSRSSTKRNIFTSPIKSGTMPDVYLDKKFKPLFVVCSFRLKQNSLYISVRMNLIKTQFHYSFQKIKHQLGLQTRNPSDQVVHQRKGILSNLQFSILPFSFQFVFRRYIWYDW